MLVEVLIRFFPSKQLRLLQPLQPKKNFLIFQKINLFVCSVTGIFVAFVCSVTAIKSTSYKNQVHRIRGGLRMGGGLQPGALALGVTW